MNGKYKFGEQPSLCIGTAQFGLPYGATNQAGQTNEHEVKKILEYAEKQGILYVDTARAYGESERVLGKTIRNHSQFKIITKIGHLKDLPKIGIDVSTFVRNNFKASLECLGTSQIYGLLVHQAEDLRTTSSHELWKALCQLKSDGQVKKIGVSVYCPEQLVDIAKRYPIDLVQFPINVLDQRFLNKEIVSLLKKKNIEAHGRSIFLQGILLQPPDRLISFFNPIKPKLKEFHFKLSQLNSSPLQGCIEFAKNSPLDCFIVGIDHFKQFEEIVLYSMQNPSFNLYFKDFLVEDENILNPQNWPKKVLIP